MIPKAQIRIEKWAQVKDANGNMVEYFDKAYNLWAEPARVGGNRSDTNGQTKLNNSVQLKIRFRPNWKISSMWKLVYNGTRYSITEIQRVNEKRFNWLINAESSKTVA